MIHETLNNLNEAILAGVGLVGTVSTVVTQLAAHLPPEWGGDAIRNHPLLKMMAGNVNHSENKE